MSVDRAIELQQQAWNLQAEGRLDEAFDVCCEALRLIEVCEGSQSPDAANLLNDLAELQCDRQDFVAAMTFADRARAIVDALGDRFTGEDAARIRIKTFGLLGELQRIQGDYDNAEPALQRALTIADATFGAASEAAAETRNNLAVLYRYCGRFSAAQQLYEDALRTIAASQGERSLAAAAVYHNIGGMLHAQGDFAAAQAPAWEAWQISREVLGDDAPGTLQDLCAYAAILDGLERYEESERLYRQALAAWQNAVGSEHYEIAANLHNLAAVLARRGFLQEAEEHYRRALAIKEKLLDEDSVDIALTRNNLGRLLAEAGRPAEALTLLRQAVASLENRLAPGHPHLEAARKNLRDALAS